MLSPTITCAINTAEGKQRLFYFLNFHYPEGQWMNESSPEPSPTKTRLPSEPDDTAQSVEIQGVPAENASHTLSDLFSSPTATSSDVEGHHFFDSIVAPTANDPFSQVIQQTDPATSKISLESTEALSEVQSMHEPSQPPLEPLCLNAQDTLQADTPPWQPEQAVPPHAPKPSQPSQVFHDPLNAMQNQGLTDNNPNALEMINISKNAKPPSAPPTPEGEWVRIKQTEAERQHSAWICNPQTNQFLVTIGSGMLNPADVDQQFLTSPGLVIEGSQVGSGLIFVV